MCRNITTLRGLQPPAVPEEIEAAARQYVRKVAGITTSKGMERDEVRDAVERIAVITTALLQEMPPRRTPPKNDPPLRRLGLVNPSGDGFAG